MKLKNEFITHISNGETVLVPTGSAVFSGVVKGNSTFGTILELLKSDTTETDIVTGMEQKYNAPRETIERDIHAILEKLREIGAIEE